LERFPHCVLRARGAYLPWGCGAGRWLLAPPSGVPAPWVTAAGGWPAWLPAMPPYDEPMFKIPPGLRDNSQVYMRCREGAVARDAS
jgi:hypothetical protein